MSEKYSELEAHLHASIARALPPEIRVHLVEPTARNLERIAYATEMALAETIRKEWASVFELGAAAIRSPKISRADTERAIVCLQHALEAATVLDPPSDAA